jgi:hypothetical protein
MPGLEVTRADSARSLLLLGLRTQGLMDDSGKPHPDAAP